MEARGTWRQMEELCERLLVRATGEDSDTWADRARAAGATDEGGLRAWLSDRGITGYAAYIVHWKVRGYPDFFLMDADELLDGQYADRQHLRPIADALLAWAGDRGAGIQLRKTYVSLMTGRRKFAQVTPATKSAVDVFLRLSGPGGAPAEPVRVREGDPFDQRVRLRAPEDLTDAAYALLERARRENS